MPCAFFVGANPHTKSTLFACALLADEKVPNYRWAFDKLRICMSGKSPRGIIQDQCKAISNAFKLEFPEARHRLCLWHIMRKVPTKLARHLPKYAVIQEIKRFVYDVPCPIEFVDGWLEMVSKYALDKNG